MKGYDVKMSKTKVLAQFYRQPRYYKDFVCIGGKCPMSCCYMWRVEWTQKEVEKLKCAECSEKLRTLADSAFKDDGDGKYIIQMNDEKRCPFLTNNGLCSIQLEIGEEYLSSTCRTYPRNSLMSENTILNYCNMSCYHLMNILCNDSDCMILENRRNSGQNLEKLMFDGDTDIIKHPELKYRNQLFELFYEIISDDSHSFETSVTLGAVAAQNISRLIQNRAYDRITHNISALKKQLSDLDQIKKLEELKPNYNVKLGFVVKLHNLIIKSNILDFIYENGCISMEKYYEGEQRFKNAFADRPFAMRNIALNFMLELKMPFRDKNASLFENYCYFVAALALIKIIAVVAFLGGGDQEKEFIISSAYLSRFFAHNDKIVRPIINLFKELNCASPAYIALILK